MSIDKKELQKVAGCTCFQIRKTARAITRFFDRHLSDVGLRSTQFSVLAGIAGRTGVTVTRLADWLGLDHSTLVRNLRPLRKQRLVSSRRGKEDRRTRELFLTDKGEELLKTAIPLWRDAQDAVLSALGHDRWDQTLEGLKAAQHFAERAESDEPLAEASG